MYPLRPLARLLVRKLAMLLKTYQKEIFRPECNPDFESLHCIAYLDQDISAVLPYLNAELGGFDLPGMQLPHLPGVCLPNG